MSTFESKTPDLRSAVELIGDRWILLILNELLGYGARRFVHLQDGLGVSPNTLSARLKHLEMSAIVARVPYSHAPPRFNYCLTPKGEAFAPVLHAIGDWAREHPPP